MRVTVRKNPRNPDNYFVMVNGKKSSGYYGSKKRANEAANATRRVHMKRTIRQKGGSVPASISNKRLASKYNYYRRK